MVTWDDISFVHATVLAMSSPLTQYLNDMPLGNYSNNRVRIWTDIFINDWEGDFEKVPKLYYQEEFQAFRHVKTRHMYERCKKHYADCLYSNRFWNMYMNHYGDNKTGVAKIEVHYIQGPAMENVWLDELENLAKYPVAWANAAVAGGHLALLKFLVAEHGIEPMRLKYIDGRYGFAMDVAADNGHLDMIKYLHAAGSQACTTKAIENAARNGHFDTVKWLCENRSEGWTSQAICKAIENDHVDIAKYLASQRRDMIDGDAMVAAISKGYFDLVKLFHEVYNLVVSWYVVDSAFHRALYALYHEVIVRTSRGAMKLTRREFLEIAKYCIERCTERYHSSRMTDAAREGRLDVIQLLHENRAIGWTEEVMNIAAAKGYLDIVKYLHENRSEGCSTKAMDEAAAQGRLDIVQYLHENRTEGCTTKAMDEAAARGCLDIVKYLHENRSEGCTKHAMDEAAVHGHLDIVKFLHYNRTEGCTKRAYFAAAGNRHFDVVQFLLENREEANHTKAMIRAGFRRKTAIVQYLHEHGHQGFTAETIDIAASMGHMDTVRYLLEHRKEGFTFMAIFWAAARGYNDILKYLLSHDRKGICLKKALEKANHDGHRKAMKSLKPLTGTKTTRTRR